MDFAFVGATSSETFGWFARGLREVMESEGHRYMEDSGDAKLVLNFFPPTRPRPVRRKANAVFVCAVTEFPVPFTEHLSQGYPFLLRSLANLVAGFVPSSDGGGADIHFVTPEQGHYVVSGGLDRENFFREVYTRIEPLAASTLVIDNIFEPDLPEELWQGDDITESIYRAGKHLEGLNLLPAPFPIHDYLAERDLRHLKRLFGIGGLSYGNLSARYNDEWFWMSASGVDKSNLKDIGQHILMVKDYDAERNGMRVSHPPGVEPRRVSVDAIEHWMIYREHPEVGAILHVHGWINGVPSTEFNYPCGTRELGQAVADIVRESDDPSRCVVGLKNHGLTITGTSLDEIFERVGARIVQTVPMN
ncbi:MAG: class II aldolase/adducin family protein [Gemmatimonadetes bacterium]|nr:class II aldolase/adducin family protein [Gemmatimonadota bacterium]MXX73701.1 class II aldolase/adducin family protein [Gemmatimonadota bacterium]MYC92392.1 class II aldolase/adducin family protein [Gemmatimonadota bacterium]MYG36021.1 class II aldolase/adducin family protein [Gemmatimonadota bacterium]MYJ18584.1 class II aldolase/adducin family protein [Gemmatimonadota bacterium]